MSRWTALGVVRLVGVTAIVATAWGGAGPTAVLAGGGGGGGGSPGPCRLLTRGEVAELLGQPVRKGRAHPSEAARECKWQARKAGTGGIDDATLALSVTLHRKNPALRQFREQVRDQDNEIIDGIGEEAFAGTFATPVAGRVGNRVFEIDIHNYDTSEWDGDPRAIVIEAGAIVGEKLARAAGVDLDQGPEQPPEVPDRFADDIPVPASFGNRIAVYGTEYDGGGSFYGDLPVEEVVAFFEDALVEAGFTMDDTRSEMSDDVPAKVIAFARNGRAGEVAVSASDSDLGATLVTISYTSDD